MLGVRGRALPHLLRHPATSVRSPGHWLRAGCVAELEARSGTPTRVGRALYVRRRTAAFVAAKAGECMRAVSAGRSAQ